LRIGTSPAGFSDVDEAELGGAVEIELSLGIQLSLPFAGPLVKPGNKGAATSGLSNMLPVLALIDQYVRPEAA